MRGEDGRRALAVAWLLVGSALVLVPAWLAWTRWEALLSGHPAMVAVAAACLLLGCVALAWVVATLLLRDNPTLEGDQLDARRLRRRTRRQVALAAPALLLCVVLLAALAWSRPLPATPAALAALQSRDGVRVADRLTWYELVPDRDDADGNPVTPVTGLVFAPGARVDPRAYARLLRPLAEAGYLVAVLKEPFGVALTNPEHAARVVEVHPELARWVVGGHSLGGVAAAGFAQDHPQVGGAPVVGLLLYAAYPASPVTRPDLAVTSVSGDLDGLTTPADVAESRDDLPASTRYVSVPGAVHSFFGDYGEQAGDGQPAVDRDTAQAEIVAASRDLLAAVTPKPRSR